jgi:hypothetical protein
MKNLRDVDTKEPRRGEHEQRKGRNVEERETDEIRRQKTRNKGRAYEGRKRETKEERRNIAKGRQDKKQEPFFDGICAADQSCKLRDNKSPPN